MAVSTPWAIRPGRFPTPLSLHLKRARRDVVAIARRSTAGLAYRCSRRTHIAVEAEDCEASASPRHELRHVQRGPTVLQWQRDASADAGPPSPAGPPPGRPTALSAEVRAPSSKSKRGMADPPAPFPPERGGEGPRGPCHGSLPGRR